MADPNDKKKNESMSNDETSIPPTEAAFEKALHDLTFDLAPDEKGGWNPEGKKHLLKGRMEGGVRIITYSFDAPKPSHDCTEYVHSFRPLNKEDRPTVLKELKKIEETANIKFSPARDGETPDIAYFSAIMKNPNMDAYQMENDIMLDIVSSRTARHETFHRLGLSHPNNNVNDLHYTRSITAMSERGQGTPTEIPPLDAALLQFLYGKPKSEVLKIPTTQADEKIQAPVTPALKPSQENSEPKPAPASLPARR